MGSALLESWRKGDGAFTIVDPYLDRAPKGVALVKSRDAIEKERFDTIVIAVKPQLIDDIVPDYRGMLTPTGYILSIAAGCSIERLKTVSSESSVIRVMPNLPAAIGKGVSGLCPSKAATEGQVAHAKDLMNRAGRVICVADEDELDRFTAIAGSGPGYVFEFARAYVEAAKNLGFSEEQSVQMVLGVIEGTISMAQQSDLSLEELRGSVTSKNGTTAAGLDALNGEGQLGALISDTLKAAIRRAVELR